MAKKITCTDVVMLLKLNNTPDINLPNYPPRGIAECCRVIQRAPLRACWMGGII